MALVKIPTLVQHHETKLEIQNENSPFRRLAEGLFARLFFVLFLAALFAFFFFLEWDTDVFEVFGS